jgi:hypothetical protein
MEYRGPWDWIRRFWILGVRYTEKPYLILSVESSQERSDWGEIPELKSSYGAIKDAVVGNDQRRNLRSIHSKGWPISPRT